MLIGLLSDSHGRAARTAAAVRLLRGLGAEALVHCGDVGGESVLAELAPGPAWFVWGNTDFPDPAAARFAAGLGVTPPAGVPRIVRLGGRSIHVYHGHEAEFEALLRRLRANTEHEAEFVAHGHTHIAHVSRSGPATIINPGALHRTAVYSVATLELRSGVVRHYRVRDEARADAPPELLPL